MLDRTLVIQHVTGRMIEAFCDGDLVGARVIDEFIASLERLTDGEYDTSATEIPGAIT